MAFFTGTFENKVDAKGRASIPADFRDVFSEADSRTFYIFPSPHLHALEACDQLFLKRLAGSIEQQADLFSPEEDELSTIIARSRRVSYDSTGRFVLTKEFLSYAHLTTRALFVGRAARFQIWNPEHYQAHIKTLQGKRSVRLQRP